MHVERNNRPTVQEIILMLIETNLWQHDTWHFVSLLDTAQVSMLTSGNTVVVMVLQQQLVRFRGNSNIISANPLFYQSKPLTWKGWNNGTVEDCGNLSQLPTKKQGRWVLLGDDLDRKVQLYLKKVRGVVLAQIRLLLPGALSLPVIDQCWWSSEGMLSWTGPGRTLCCVGWTSSRERWPQQSASTTLQILIG